MWYFVLPQGKVFVPVPTQVLFVDDEPSIRLTLPTILRQNGFEVTATASVAEALAAIHSQPFDALIADLNIGEPGDGFTIVSAMRRTQPKCVNLILTGYPAFETALQAIRSQVDDYLVKPADIHTLVQALRAKLEDPKQVRCIQSQPLARFMSEHSDEILARTLKAMEAHPRLSKVSLTRKQRTGHIPEILRELIRRLQSQERGEPSDAALKAGVKHAKARRQQGYTQSLLVDDIRVLDTAIYDVVQDKLLNLELSNLIPDLSSLNDTLDAHLQEALRVFSEEEAA